MARSAKIPSECIETIRGEGPVLDQFRDLCASRSVIYVELDAVSRKTYISRMQGIQADNTLLIEPLMPPGGGELIGEATSIKVGCISGGVRHEFETSLVGVVKGALPALVLDLPSEIRLIVARQHPRISFSDGAGIPVKVIRSAGPALAMDGTAVQLGTGGMGVIVPPSAEWDAGTMIEKLMFSLPSGQLIRSAASVRSTFPLYQPDGSISGYRCNLQFIKLEQRYAAILEAFVFRKQLEDGLLAA
ncbi:MAG: flagellar brake domain-containing protein [Nitrospirota bacterium]|nr:flagellar brake domain-containing protein [Nitrospirota bacterium]